MCRALAWSQEITVAISRLSSVSGSFDILSVRASFDVLLVGAQSRSRVQISSAAHFGLHWGRQVPLSQTKPGEQIGSHASSAGPPEMATSIGPGRPRAKVAFK